MGGGYRLVGNKKKCSSRSWYFGKQYYGQLIHHIVSYCWSASYRPALITKVCRLTLGGRLRTNMPTADLFSSAICISWHSQARSLLSVRDCVRSSWVIKPTSRLWTVYRDSFSLACKGFWKNVRPFIPRLWCVFFFLKWRLSRAL